MEYILDKKSQNVFDVDFKRSDQLFY